ncbi:MAG: hypothetical protein ACI9UR_002796, partial [Bacteroidia bacterium]
MFDRNLTIDKLSELLKIGKLEIADETLLSIEKSADYLL